MAYFFAPENIETLVDGVAVGSAAIVVGVVSLGTSHAGLPELEKK